MKTLGIVPMVEDDSSQEELQASEASESVTGSCDDAPCDCDCDCYDCVDN